MLSGYWRAVGGVFLAVLALSFAFTVWDIALLRSPHPGQVKFGFLLSMVAIASVGALLHWCGSQVYQRWLNRP